MEIKVDQDKCIGCGRCTEICPLIFKLNDQGKVDVMNSDDIDCAKKAADDCPQEAIAIEVEVDTGIKTSPVPDGS
ncbi:MAG: ferredoxin [Patescibacteria group bacterium]|nr:ferredoxin [Patescibacteria group bacterium]